ncbi:MAG TPA: nucleotidyltransferase family protein [Terracidiphilus sp.]|nr:nucleotidyltransferase family protein [Terracidiphilus sp.]
MPDLCGVILAAGASSRMGRDKALLPWPTLSSASTLLSAHIAALKPFARAIVVVAGKNVDRLAPIVAASGATLAINPAPDRGQFSSLQIGLGKALDLGCDSAMITPVDCAPLNPETLSLLRTEFEEKLALAHWAVAPTFNGRNGHPLFASRSLINAFLGAPPTSNAREIRRAHFERFVSIPVSIPNLAADMNTPDEYAATITRSQSGPA